MFQVLTTMFFSAALMAALGVITTMLSDNLVEIRGALGLGSSGSRQQARLPARRAERLSPVRQRPIAAAHWYRAAA
jgi:hypothetical protein